MTTSILFCIGPIAVLGCAEDWTPGLSAGSVLVVQGILTLGAGVLKPIVSPVMVSELTATGGVMFIGLALNLLGLKQIHIANFLPTLVLAPLLAHFVRL